MSSRIFRTWLALAMAVLTVTGTLACSSISSAEHEQALVAQAAAAQAQIDTITQDHGKQVAELTSELDEAREEVAGLETEAAALRAAGDAQLENVERLEVLLSQELEAAQESREVAVDAARRETRWTWDPGMLTDGGEIFSVVGWAFSLEEVSPLQIGLYAECIQDESNYLYLWDDVIWEDETEYIARVGLDGGRPRNETVWGFGGAFGAFADLDGKDLWELERIHVELTYGDDPSSVTFDTAQLRRMFPTEADFCNGEKPVGY